MARQHLTPEDVRRAEALVMRIPGISSCRIQTDANGVITEVHVVAHSDKSPKLIARDVETCLKAEIDVAIDHKKIGVAVVGEEHAPEAEEEAMEEFAIIEHASRFVFVTINLSSSRDGMRAEVELSRDSTVAFGASSTDNVTAPSWTVVAEATLRAVSEFLDDSMRLCLSGVLKVPMGDAEAMVARVDLIGPRFTKSLIGCALVTENEGQSAVFATLDAVNRVIGKLDFKRSVEYKIQ